MLEGFLKVFFDANKFLFRILDFLFLLCFRQDECNKISDISSCSNSNDSFLEVNNLGSLDFNFENPIDFPILSSKSIISMVGRGGGGGAK